MYCVFTWIFGDRWSDLYCTALDEFLDNSMGVIIYNINHIQYSTKRRGWWFRNKTHCWRWLTQLKVRNRVKPWNTLKKHENALKNHGSKKKPCKAMQIQWKTMKTYHNIEEHGQPLKRPSTPKDHCPSLQGVMVNWTTIRCSYGSRPWWKPLYLQYTHQF